MSPPISGIVLANLNILVSDTEEVDKLMKYVLHKIELVVSLPGVQSAFLYRNVDATKTHEYAVIYSMIDIKYAESEEYLALSRLSRLKDGRQHVELADLTVRKFKLKGVYEVNDQQYSTSQFSTFAR